MSYQALKTGFQVADSAAETRETYNYFGILKNKYNKRRLEHPEEYRLTSLIYASRKQGEEQEKIDWKLFGLVLLILLVLSIIIVIVVINLADMSYTIGGVILGILLTWVVTFVLLCVPLTNGIKRYRRWTV